MKFDEYNVVLKYGLAWIPQRDLLLEALRLYEPGEKVSVLYRRLANKHDISVNKIEYRLRHAIDGVYNSGYLENDKGILFKFIHLVEQGTPKVDYIPPSELPGFLQEAVEMANEYPELTYEDVCAAIAKNHGMTSSIVENTLHNEVGALLLPEDLTIRKGKRNNIGVFRQIKIYVYACNNTSLRRRCIVERAN